MSWMRALYDTYCNLEKGCESDQHIKLDLRALCQSTQNCHIEVVVDKNSNFVSAQIIPKGDSETIIPVTEKSGSRSNGSAPHPLFDKIKYLAGDYETYCNEKNEQFHSDYMAALQKWIESPWKNEKVYVVYKYLLKNQLINDLVQYGVFSVNGDTGLITDKWENTSEPMTVGGQKDAMIRFMVTGVDEKSNLWEDERIQSDFINYYLKTKTDKEFCYILGERLPVGINHPSKIRNTADKAKIISSHDTVNFTYRGRFSDAKHAFTMSYEASQKCHNALKFLIKNQGVHVGDRTYVLWGTNREKVPSIIGSTLDCSYDDDEPDCIDTKYEIARRFNNAIRGYKAQLTNKSELVLLGLDSATTGRMAVVFAREYLGQQGNELIDHINEWHQTCRWRIFFWSEEKKKIYYEGIPSLYVIAESAFGIEQGKGISCDKKLKANIIQRLIPCVVDGAPVPRDIINAAVRKALHPLNYKEEYLWDQVLSVACVLYGKDICRQGKEISMEIKEHDASVEYNCGRLLAVADELEKWSLRSKSSGKDIRTTNAIRYFTRFSQRPEETWGIIRKKLMVHEEHLGEKGRRLYKLMGEISDKIDFAELGNSCDLGGAFCLGFDSQRLVFIREAEARRKRKEEGKTVDNEVEE